MGNIIKNGNEVKSNLFRCSGCTDEKNMCVQPNIYSEIRVGDLQDNNSNLNNINYVKTPDILITPGEYIRSLSSIDRKNNFKRIKNNNNSKLNQYNINFREESIEKFNKEKFESNPKIKELISLIGENSDFELTEKESFYIKNTLSKNFLIKKLLHYKDDSYYLGFINKYNNNKELFGRYYYNDGSIYKGFFENDKMKGRGRLILINRYIYEGDFDDGLFNGFGKLYTINGSIYEGNWKNDIQEGFGIEKYLDGSYYSGTFKKGIKNGKGKYIYKNGDIYEGDFENDKMTGMALFKKKDGKIYFGMFKDNKIEGIGIFIWKDNKRYIGEYHNELKEGFGIFYTSDGRNYEGFWKEGKQDRFGVITNIYGQKYYIKYNNGKKDSISFSEQEKKDIDNIILEGEKKINKNKLIKKAEEIIIQKEKEQKIENDKIVKFNINKTYNNKNDKNKNKLFGNNNEFISENNKLFKFNRNISVTNNKIKSNYKYNILKKDEISNVSPFLLRSLEYNDNEIILNNILKNKNTNTKTNIKNINKSSISKNDGDRNTTQTSKIINKNNNNKNKSCPNLYSHFNKNKINCEKKIKKCKSENKILHNNISKSSNIIEINDNI